MYTFNNPVDLFTVAMQVFNQFNGTLDNGRSYIPTPQLMSGSGNQYALVHDDLNTLIDELSLNIY